MIKSKINILNNEFQSTKIVDFNRLKNLPPPLYQLKKMGMVTQLPSNLQENENTGNQKKFNADEQASKLILYPIEKQIGIPVLITFLGFDFVFFDKKVSTRI